MLRQQPRTRVGESARDARGGGEHAPQAPAIVTRMSEAEFPGDERGRALELTCGTKRCVAVKVNVVGGREGDVELLPSACAPVETPPRTARPSTSTCDATAMPIGAMSDNRSGRPAARTACQPAHPTSALRGVLLCRSSRSQCSRVHHGAHAKRGAPSSCRCAPRRWRRWCPRSRRPRRTHLRPAFLRSGHRPRPGRGAPPRRRADGASWPPSRGRRSRGRTRGARPRCQRCRGAPRARHARRRLRAVAMRATPAAQGASTPGQACGAWPCRGWRAFCRCTKLSDPSKSRTFVEIQENGP